jgi:ParB family chromosome partitioning protein
MTMNIQHITLENLTPTAINVRKTGARDVDGLVQSIRTIGLLQPLLVRPVGKAFEVVAGQRRFHALSKIAEGTEVDPIPCVVMSADDDATAVERHWRRTPRVSQWTRWMNTRLSPNW